MKRLHQKDVADVRADDPEHATERFTNGLRRVLSQPKPSKQPGKRKKRRR